jgi:Protein of unknown function (DUF2911)
MIFPMHRFCLLTTTLICSFLAACNNDQQISKNNSGVKDSLSAKASVNPYVSNDQSPMDMSYYPPDYPVLRMNGTDSGNLAARVIYSRPQKKGRVIFGDAEKSLRPYGKEWRLGANEATEIEFFKPVTITGKKIDKGRYVIYCIPFPDSWTIVLNSNLYTWGLHMDTLKDVFRVSVPVQAQRPGLEDFTIVFEQASYGADLIMAWDNVKAVLPISFSK